MRRRIGHLEFTGCVTHPGQHTARHRMRVGHASRLNPYTCRKPYASNSASAAVGSVRHRGPVSICYRPLPKSKIKWPLSVATNECSRPLLPFEQSEVQRRVSDWSSRPTKSLNDNLSAIADVGRWCLEGRLCFALPTFDHVSPKTWSDQSERLLSENGNFRYRPIRAGQFFCFKGSNAA